MKGNGAHKNTIQCKIKPLRLFQFSQSIQKWQFNVGYIYDDRLRFCKVDNDSGNYPMEIVFR